MHDTPYARYREPPTLSISNSNRDYSYPVLSFDCVLVSIWYKSLYFVYLLFSKSKCAASFPTLTGRSLKDVVNGQSFKAHEIKTGVFQCSLLVLTIFLLYINDLPRNINQFLVNIYAFDTTVYR